MWIRIREFVNGLFTVLWSLVRDRPTPHGYCLIVTTVRDQLLWRRSALFECVWLITLFNYICLINICRPICIIIIIIIIISQPAAVYKSEVKFK